ncbi:hypothetical protein [Streptomyces sp. NPDC000880]
MDALPDQPQAGQLTDNHDRLHLSESCVSVMSAPKSSIIAGVTVGLHWAIADR